MNIFTYSDLSISNTILIKHGKMTIPYGSLFYLSGPNGCGKSTIFKMMLGLKEKYFSDNEWGWSINWDRYGYVEQAYERTIIPWLSINSNINYYCNAISVSRKSLLSDLTDYKKRAYSLSGGIKQRIAVVKELGIGSGLLLLDEPFSNQSRKWHSPLSDVIDEFCENDGVIGIITHEDHLVTSIKPSIFTFNEIGEKDGRRVFVIQNE